MPRRHRTRRRRYGGKRRTRRQRGGAPAIESLVEWIAQAKAARAAAGADPITMAVSSLRSESLRLPPQTRRNTGAGTEVESHFELDVPYATRDARAVAANIRGFLEQLAGKPVLDLDGGAVQQLIQSLETKAEMKDSLDILAAVESALRGETISTEQLRDTDEYPLMLVYLLANTEGDPVPILDSVKDLESTSTQAPQAPAVPAE